jgi:cyclase
MLTKRIIPCLDVRDGRVVKGINFVNITDAGDPVELAQEYYRQGADELIFLDITASYEKRKIMIDVVREVAKVVFIPLTVGGGISSIEDVDALMRVGADKVSVNTAAIKDPNLITTISERYGNQAVVVAIDAKSKGDSWEVYINGGRDPTGIDAIEWAKEVQSLGAGDIMLTSMDRDGTKIGYDLELTSTMAKAVNIPIIASGGCGELAHVVDAFGPGKADAALMASIFHYDEYTVEDVKLYLRDSGVEVRL